MLTYVTARGVSFELPNGRNLINNLSFSLTHRLTALVGPNGIGKTTLARLLSGALEPTSGRIVRATPTRWFAQTEDPPAPTIAEYVSMEVAWSVTASHLLSELDLDRRCDQLSGGEWMRVRLARVLEDEFLILDEPTNDLDREGRKALLEFLRQHRAGALLIAHDREALALCDEIFELSPYGITKFGGGWSEYSAAKATERDRLERRLEKAKAAREQARSTRHEKLERQNKRNRQGKAAGSRGGMPAILLGARKRRAQTTTGVLDRQSAQATEAAVSDAREAFSALKVDPVMYSDLMGEPNPASKLVLEARAFNIRRHHWLYANDLTFSWRGNLRLALRGANGSGKSTLLQAMMGAAFETRGILRIGSMKTLHIDQQSKSLDLNKTVLENVRERSHFDERELRNRLAQFLFTKETVFQAVGTLSGGERLRAALAKGFLSQESPELLILDEPTNNLDLVNIEFLENLVRQFRGAMIVISHDEVFLENCELDEELML